MPRRCSVPGCRSNYRDKSAAGKYVSCYGFPSDAKTLEKWLDAIGRRNFVPNYDNAVCAKHFDDSSFVCEDMYRGANGELKVFKFAKPKLRNEAVPSKFLHGNSEREKQIERNDGFGVSEGVKTRSSTLNNLLNQDDAVFRNNAFLKAEDRKSCLDFVDVEMKSPETEEKPLNLSEYECLDLRKKCGPLEKNGLSGNETVVFNGGGERQQNFDAVSLEVGGKLLGKRGVDDRSHFDSTTNCEFRSQQIHCGEPDSDSGSFVKRVKVCEELNRQNPFRHAAALKLDRPDEGNLKRRTDGNHEATNLNNSSNVETSSAVLSGEIGVVAKKEKSVSGEAVKSLVVKDVVRSDSVGKNYEVHDDSGADIRYEDHRSEKKFKKFQTDCVDLSSGGCDSDGGSLCGKINGGENLENKNTTRVEENASLVLEKDVKSDHKRPCLASETDVDAKISNTGKNRVSLRNIKKKGNGCCEDKGTTALSSQQPVVLKKGAVIVPGNDDLVLTGTCNDDRGFIISKNRGLVKNTKKVNSSDNIGRYSSFGNVEAEIDNKSRATSGPEIGDGDGRNSSPDDVVESVQRISVNSKKKPQKNLGDVNSNQRQNSGFSLTTKNQCGAISVQNGEFVSTGTKLSPNEDGQLGQVIFVKNMEQLLKGFDDINNKNECPGDVAKSESSVFKQEKLNLLNQDNKSRQVDFEKNSKKIQGDRCSGSGFAISVNEKGTTPNQEINNLLVIDANFIQNYVPAEEVASVKNCEKFQRNCSSAVSKNGKRAVSSQERCNLVLMDAKLGLDNNVKCGQVVSVKNLKIDQRHFGDTRSANGLDGVKMDEKIAAPCQTNVKFMLTDENLELNDDIKSGQVVSMKNLKQILRNFGGSTSDFCGVRKNEDMGSKRAASNRNLFTNQKHFGDSGCGGSELTNGVNFVHVETVNNSAKIRRNVDMCSPDPRGFVDVTKNEKRNISDIGKDNLALVDANLELNGDSKSGQVVSVKNLKKVREIFDDTDSPSVIGGFTMNERISGQENGNFALMDANLELKGDSKSGKMVSEKNLTKNKKLFDDSSCGFSEGTINGRRAGPGQENSVVVDANSALNGDIRSGKNLKMVRRNFEDASLPAPSGFGVVAKNETRAISGQENGNLVLMDANLELKGDSESGKRVSEKILTKNKKLFDDSSCGFGEGTINERRADHGQENSVVMDVNSALNGDIRFGKNLKMVRRNFEDTSLPAPSGFGVVTKNERRAISGQENGNLVLMDANLIPSYGTGPVGEPEVKVDGQICGSEKTGEDEGPSEAQEWEGWAVKEELFRGLGLVPRGVLHDRSVDRRHCVSGSRRSESAKGKTAVFYPPGTAMFDTERFIGEIQRRPAIYDVRSKVYSNRVAKLKYWHEVGQEMYKGWDALDQMERRTLVKELQIKWKSIRDHFMRQLKQNMNGEGPKKKKYVHFDQLQFLTANLGVKRPRHSFKPTKQEPEEEYMELTPELPEERHFSFMSSVGRPDYDEHEVPVAATLLPQQPEDLSYNTKDLSYHHHKELSYHKELEGDRMGNKMFLLSLLPIMERLPDHSNIRARLQLMEVLQTFVAHEDASHRDFYNYHDEKQSCGEASQQHSTASHSDSDS